MTHPDEAPALRRPAGRYGPAGRPPDRRLLAAAAAAVGLLSVGWFGYVAFGPGDPGVHALDVGYQVVGDTAVRVTFEVQKDPAATAVCTLRALNAGFAEVGRTDVRIGPGQDAAVTLTAVVPTSELAVTGNVKACTLR